MLLSISSWIPRNDLKRWYYGGDDSSRLATCRESSPKMGMNMDTSMDDNSEDLLLYEATVTMVRKTPTKLNLNLKRPMKSRGKAIGETKEVILRIIVFVLWSIVVISGFYSLARLDDCQLLVVVYIVYI